MQITQNTDMLPDSVRQTATLFANDNHLGKSEASVRVAMSVLNTHHNCHAATTTTTVGASTTK
jgi:hypothetical protein